MRERRKKTDPGTIFNPVMYLVVLLLTAQLLLLFVEYKRVSWVSAAVTDAMTDALLGACILNETELYHYGTKDQPEILYPKEKYDIFKDILGKELGLTENLQTTDNSLELLTGDVSICDFEVYSVQDGDIVLYDFNEKAGYTTTLLEGMAGKYDAGNGKVIESTTLVAEIAFTVRFFQMPVQVRKYHMVDMTN